MNKMNKALAITSIALATTLSLSTAFAAPAETKPYCTAANNNAHWWTWTADTIESACYTAMMKTFKNGKHINALYRGHYKVNGLNKASLRCQEGKKKVIGQGSEVFSNAANMRSQLGWKKSCVVIIKN